MMTALLLLIPAVFLFPHGKKMTAENLAIREPDTPPVILQPRHQYTWNMFRYDLHRDHLGHQAHLRENVARIQPAPVIPPAAPAVITPAGYADPIGTGLVREQVDMGVDFGGSGDLYALGDGTVMSTWNAGWPGGTFIVIRLDDKKAIYYAEDITSAVTVTEKVHAGEKIGYAYGGGIEVGWADPSGDGNTMAADLGEHYWPTAEGESMDALLASL